jgi:hypothetical protein
MRETRSSGSVRGASGDGRPYRERDLAVGLGIGEGPLPRSGPLISRRVGATEGASSDVQDQPSPKAALHVIDRTLTGQMAYRPLPVYPR